MLQKAYQGKKDFIFISYAHKDKAIAFKFIEKLQSKYNVWYDEGIHFGKEWDKEIEEKLAKSKIFIFLISKNSIASDNCLDEVNYAKLKEKVFINVLLENVDLSEDFMLRYGRFQMLKLYEKSYDEALEIIEDSCDCIEDVYKIENTDSIIKKKQKSKKKILLIALIFVILLCGAGIGTYFGINHFFGDNSKDTYEIKNASIDGSNIYLRINSNSDKLDLAKEIKTSGKTKWDLYYDKGCQNIIQNKIASNNGKPLDEGNNVFYLKITANGKTNIYTLNIYKYKIVNVSYEINGVIDFTEEKETGTNYIVNYIPNVKGYEFNKWLLDGNEVSNIYLEEDITFIGYVSAKNYLISFPSEYNLEDIDINYGDSLQLEKLEKEGYDFLGWESDGILVSNENGLIESYSIDRNVVLTPLFIIKNYNISYDYDKTMGSVSGSFNSDYNSEVTVIAKGSLGYEIDSYEINGTKHETNSDNFKFTMPSTNVDLKINFKKIYKKISEKYYIEGTDVTYLSYPQSLLNDNTIITELNNMAGNTPEDNNYYNWTPFDFKYYNILKFNDNTDSEYDYEFYDDYVFYYIDIDYNNDGKPDYRGIYFKYYMSFFDYSDQNDYTYIYDQITNGEYSHQGNYERNTVYWFKYEPVKWTLYYISENNYSFYTNYIVAPFIRDGNQTSSPPPLAIYDGSIGEMISNNNNQNLSFKENEDMNAITDYALVFGTSTSYSVHIYDGCAPSEWNYEGIRTLMTLEL